MSQSEGQTHQPEGEEGAEETQWKSEIKERLGAVKEAEESCIYQVPNKLRKVREDAYNPRVVSIGPLHRNNTDLVAAMREHKWRYMRSFLQLTDYPVKYDNERLERCLKAIYGSDKEVRQCYAADIKYNKNELSKIMLLDGCFILELFLGLERKKKQKKVEKADPILKNDWMIAALQHDLALLENQIPFFILKRLYDIVKPCLDGAPLSVTSLALKFFQHLSRKTIPEDQNGLDQMGTDFKHLIDLLHKFYFSIPEVSINVEPDAPSGPSEVKQQPACLFWGKIFKRRKQQTASPEPDPPAGPSKVKSLFWGKIFKRGTQPTASPEPDTPAGPSKVKSLFWGKIFNRGTQLTASPEPDPPKNNKWGFNYCASELSESGIEFRAGYWDSLLEITFENGVISIPQLNIDEATSSLFRNLIAFEQYSLGSTHGVTSYAFLMKSLISSSADTKLLRERWILKHNRIGDHEYLSQFKDILDEVVAKDGFHFEKLRDQVNEYCTSWSLRKLQVFLRVRFLREIRDLFNTYFSSTWSFTSLLAASALLLLASLQTYYTIHPRR